MTVQYRNSPDTWGAVARGLHWLIALLILAQFVIGNVAEEMKLTPAKLDLFVWHKSIGVTILLLALLRLVWRLGNPPPAPPAGTPRWEQRLAAAAHAVLYVLLFAVPMPDFLATDREVQEIAAEVHEALIAALLLVVIAHIAAALRHHFLLRDDVLSRMLTGRHSRD